MIYLLRIISGITTIIGVLWLYFEPGLAPLVSALSCLCFFISTFIYQKVKKSGATKQDYGTDKTPEIGKLNDRQESLLHYFLSTDKIHLPENQIINDLGMEYHKAKHLLESLESARILGSQNFYNGSETNYFLADIGRYYIFK